MFRIIMVMTAILAVINGILLMGVKSSPMRDQPTEVLYLCGERVPPLTRSQMRAGVLRKEVILRWSEEGQGVQEQEVCHNTRIWYTPGTRYLAQTAWGQGVEVPPQLLAEWEATGWTRSWWDGYPNNVAYDNEPPDVATWPRP